MIMTVPATCVLFRTKVKITVQTETTTTRKSHVIPTERESIKEHKPACMGKTKLSTKT